MPCPVCGGSIGMFGDCIECGTCAICFPERCVCVILTMDADMWYEEEEEELYEEEGEE